MTINEEETHTNLSGITMLKKNYIITFHYLNDWSWMIQGNTLLWMALKITISLYLSRLSMQTYATFKLSKCNTSLMTIIIGSHGHDGSKMSLAATMHADAIQINKTNCSEYKLFKKNNT